MNKENNEMRKTMLIDIYTTIILYIIIQRPLGTNLTVALSCSKYLLYLLFSLTN